LPADLRAAIRVRGAGRGCRETGEGRGQPRACSLIFYAQTLVGRGHSTWKIGFRFGVARKGGGTEAERWWAEAAGAPLEPPANDIRLEEAGLQARWRWRRRRKRRRRLLDS
jgi:hypothetical protein